MSKKTADAKASKKAAKKAERAALELEAQRAAAAEAERAERKAAKKAAKKSKPEPAAEPTPAPEGGLVALAAAEKVLDDPNASEGAKRKAAKIKGDALGGMTDADLRARVQAKRAEREALEAQRDEVDRDDEAAVAAYNARLIELGGGHLLTSTAERDARAAALRPGADVRTEAEAWKAPSVTPIAEKADAEAERMVAEVVATEEGDVIAVGPERPVLADVADESIALPSEAPKTLAENGNRQYVIERPSDGREVGYTRATTYIANLEDTSALEKWKMRLVLEGAAVAESDLDEHALVAVRDLVHRRDVTIAKAHKADRKGKLKPGQLGALVESAWADYKRGIGQIAERMLEVGGAHEKREKGTDLHALCEVADAEGIEAVYRRFLDDEITAADFADVDAYVQACAAAGLKMLEAETVIVNDELKVAGRLDRVVMYRKPGASRGTKVVGDIKTGRIDYGAGKIAQQIALYASGQRYDLETHERTPLGVSKTLGLLIHLPAGKATCTIYEVDLTTGARGVKLSGEVRRWRNEGKKAIDMKAPVVSVGAEVAS